MVCEEKTRLVAEYKTATNTFAASVTELQRAMGTSPKADYDRLQRCPTSSITRPPQRASGRSTP